MKASDIMQKKVAYVTPETSLQSASKIIFGKSHMGLPVVARKTKRLVGFITDQDILSQCFPTMNEYIEDTVHARNFLEMEKKLKEIIMATSHIANPPICLLVLSSNPKLKCF